jgi:hypothetical protein
MAMPVVPAVTDFGQAVMGSLALALAMFVGFIPKLIGALLILLVGWLIARLAYGLVVRGLRLVHFNQIADRAEIDQFLASAGVRVDPATVVATLAYWFLLLIFVGAAFNAFGLPQVTDMVNRILAYIPNVVVAVVVLLLGALAANFVGNLVRGAASTSHLGDPDLIAALARGAVLVFASLIALDQLQIAPAIVNTLWMALIGMFALAGALAFGLGGRDVARRMLEDWYNRRAGMARLAGTAPEMALSQPDALTPPQPRRRPLTDGTAAERHAA